MDEVWKPVVAYEGLYEVSNLGRVRSLYREGWHDGRWGRLLMRFPARVMRASASPSGYRYVKLKQPGQKARHCLIHRLVMAAHVGPPGDGLQVNHKDGDKDNNTLSNLEYCTSLENLRHCIDVLGKKRGEGAAAKVRESDVRPIRADNRPLKAIAADYGVTLQAIWLIKKRRNWAHVSD